MSSADRQRARRDLADGRTGPASRRRERERQAERLIAEVLSVLSQRDVLVAGLERRAGRCLADVRALGWPSAAVTAQACGLSLREAVRLRRLASPELSVPAATVTSSEVQNGQHQRVEGE